MQLTGKLLCPDVIALEAIRGSPPMTGKKTHEYESTRSHVTYTQTGSVPAIGDGTASPPVVLPWGYPKICKAQRF